MSVLRLQVGLHIKYRETSWIIVQHQPGNKLVLRSIHDGQVEVIDIEVLDHEPETPQVQPVPTVDILTAHPEQLQYAEKRYSWIKPMLAVSPELRSWSKYMELSKSTSKSAVWLKKLVERQENSSGLTSLMRQPRSDKDTVRLSPEVEPILKKLAESFYAEQKSRRTPKYIFELLQGLCLKEGIRCPSIATVYKYLRLEYPEIARKQKEVQAQVATPGTFRDAAHPLAVVMIDHAILDIFVISEVDGSILGRPWLTVAIDVFTRLPVGIYLSLDAPNAHAVGMCIAHAILPKEAWFAAMGIEVDWPAWGKPDVIHADNGKDFRAESIQVALTMHGMEINWRKVKTPHWGAYIERLIGTIMRKIRFVPGATGASLPERKTLNPARDAIFTLKQLEVWVATFLFGEYPNTVHSKLGMTPIQKVQMSYYGKTAVRGLPDRIKGEDARTLRIDFKPFKERSVRHDGVHLFSRRYHHPILNAFITTQQNRTKYRFRYDPRDLSVIYFCHPIDGVYHEIPRVDLSHSTISIWDDRSLSESIEPDGSIKDDAASNLSRLENTLLMQQLIDDAAKSPADQGPLPDLAHEIAPESSSDDTPPAPLEILKDEGPDADAPEVSPAPLEVLKDTDADDGDQAEESITPFPITREREDD